MMRELLSSHALCFYHRAFNSDYSLHSHLIRPIPPMAAMAYVSYDIHTMRRCRDTLSPAINISRCMLTRFDEDD